MYSSSIPDLSGNQAGVFREYIESLKKFTGASLEPISRTFEKSLIYQCEDCGRKTWQNKCMYCGGNVRPNSS